MARGCSHQLFGAVNKVTLGSVMAKVHLMAATRSTRRNHHGAAEKIRRRNVRILAERRLSMGASPSGHMNRPLTKACCASDPGWYGGGARADSSTGCSSTFLEAAQPAVAFPDRKGGFAEQ